MSQDVAALGLSVESTGVVKANDALDDFAKKSDKASTSADKLGTSAKRAAQGEEVLSKSVQDALRMVEMLEKTQGTAASRAMEMAQSAQKAAQGINSVGPSAGQVAQGMRNLAFQAQDLGVQLAMAASSSNPLKGALMALVMQGPQIKDALNQTGQSAGQLALNFAKAHPLLIAAGAAAGVAAAGIGLISSEINENSKRHVTWMDTALGTYDALKAYLTGQLTGAFKSFGVSTTDVWGKVLEYTKWASNRIIGAITLVPRALINSWQLIPAGAADIFYSAVNAAIGAINSLLSKSVSGVNGFINTANTILAKANMALPTLTAPQIAKVANSYAGAGAKLGTTLAKTIGDTMSRDFIGDMAKAISPFAQERALDRLKKDAKKAGEHAGKELGKKAGEKAAEDWIAAMQRADLADFYRQFASDQAKAWEDFNDRVRNTVNDRFEQQRMADKEAAAALNEELERTIGLLESMGKVGGTLGALFGIINGKTGSLSGPLGDLLNTSFMAKDIDGKEVGRTIGEELKKVFDDKIGPEFGKTLSEALKGAGTGMLAAQTLLGKQSSSQQIGSAIGGAAGKALGNALAGPLGGAIGSIAGGILGSVVGGLFKSTKYGGVNISATGASAAFGNSAKYERAAMDAGGSIFASLTRLAEQLGTTVRDFGSIAFGVRDGDYRVNVAGTSLKTGKGAMNFGEDANAAAAYAIQQAIAKGAFDGLSEGFQRLLKAGGPIEEQLNKALSLQGAMNELSSLKDPEAYALGNLDKQFANLRAIATEAGEGLAQVEELYGLKRAEIVAKYAAEVVDTEELLRTNRAIEIDIMQLEGRTVEALAASRALEQQGLDASTIALLNRRNALQDEAERTRVAAEAAEKAAQAAEEIAAARQAEADEARQLAIAIAEIENPALAAAMVLADQRAAILEVNRADFDRLQGLKEAQKAAQAAEAAQKAERDATTAIIDQRRALHLQITQMTDAEAYLKIVREDELRAADESVRALLLHKYALEDQAKAAASAAQAAEALAAKQKAVADERYGLDTQWLQLIGDTATLRARELALLDPSNRALQEQIWAEQDRKAAMEAATKASEAAALAQAESARMQAEAVERARNTLAQAYQRESSALQQTIDKMRGFAESIRDFRNGLTAQVNPAAGYGTARNDFLRTSNMAALGDEKALGSITNDAQKFLEIARDRASTALDYQRDYALVMSGLNKAEAGAGGLANAAERQLRAMEAQVKGIVDLNEKQVSFTEALNAYTAVTQQQAPMLTDTINAGLEAVAAKVELADVNASKAAADSKVALETSTIALNRIERMLSRWDGDDGMRVVQDGTISVSVDNTEADPVLVSQV
jgi:hypothetical protein